MKTSCNGCRILRKGCSDNCALRPCLDWIKTPESQANATLFLAKFYGRAGLLNLINAGPNHLRPTIFRSLLYEACGRIVNPVYGSVGLQWSNNWDTCQSAVDAVLRGSPIVQSSPHDSAGAAMHPIMPLEGCDIHHLSKDQTGMGQGQAQIRCRGKERPNPVAEFEPNLAGFFITGWQAPSHESSVYSVETVEGLLTHRAGSGLVVKPEPESSKEAGIGLELSLALQSSVAGLRG